MAERIKDKKMDIEDCVFLSKHISTFLEVYDPISSSYVLEVSSPGFDRVLMTSEHFNKYLNEEVKVKLKVQGPPPEFITFNFRFPATVWRWRRIVYLFVGVGVGVVFSPRRITLGSPIWTMGTFSIRTALDIQWGTMKALAQA